MSTKIYKWQWLRRNQEWTATLDRLRMQIADNQFLGLYTLFGPGIIHGWDVISWNDFSEEDADQIAAKGLTYLTQAEINALSETTKAGLNHTDVRMCLKITSGDGIVGVWPGYTTIDTYYAIPKNQINETWYVYVVPTEALREPQKHKATILVTQDRDYDSTNVAVYLAAVYVQYSGGVHSVYQITTETSRRIELYQLKGVAQAEAWKAFLRHVHNGEGDNPSKIILTTQNNQAITPGYPPASPIYISSPVYISASLLYGPEISEISEHGVGDPGFTTTGTWYYCVTFSATNKGKLQESVAGTILSVVVTSIHNTVELTWEKVVGASYYNVYRSHQANATSRQCYLLKEEIYDYSYIDNGDSNLFDDEGNLIIPPDANEDYIIQSAITRNVVDVFYHGAEESASMNSLGQVDLKTYTIPGIGQNNTVFGQDTDTYTSSELQTYHKAEVYLNGHSLNPNDYTLIKNDGASAVVSLKNNIQPEDKLEIVLKINPNETQVTGNLPEGRIGWVNAESIESGVISKRFLTAPPHYGLERIREPAFVSPYNDMRTNDYQTYYIIDPNGEIQFDDWVVYIGQSSNISPSMGVPPADSFSSTSEATLGGGYFYDTQNTAGSTTNSSSSNSSSSSSGSSSGDTSGDNSRDTGNSGSLTGGIVSGFSFGNPQIQETTTSGSGSSFGSTDKKYVVGAAKGNYITENFQYFEKISALPGDNGIIIYCIDNNIMGEGDGGQYFTETYVLLNTGKVFYTTDGFQTFTEFPSYPTTNFFVTAFTASTDKIPKIGSAGAPDVFTGEYRYERVFYIGGKDLEDTAESGVWQGQIAETVALEDIPWALWTAFQTTKPGTVYTIKEIVTLNTNTSQGVTIERYDRTAYAGTDVGLYINEAYKQGVNATQIHWIKNNHMTAEEIALMPKEKRYGSVNDILVQSDDAVYISHSAKYHIETTQDVTRTWWDHPLTRKVDRLWKTFDTTSYGRTEVAGIGEGYAYYFLGCDTGAYFVSDSLGTVQPSALNIQISIDAGYALGAVPIQLEVIGVKTSVFLMFELEVYADLSADEVLLLPDADYAKYFGFGIPSWKLIGNSNKIKYASNFLSVSSIRSYGVGPPNKAIGTKRYGPFAGSKYDDMTETDGYNKFRWEIDTSGTTITITFENGDLFICVNKSLLSGSGTGGAMDTSTKVLWIYRNAYKMVMYTIDGYEDHIEFSEAAGVEGSPPDWQDSYIGGNSASGSSSGATTASIFSDLPAGSGSTFTTSNLYRAESIIIGGKLGCWIGEYNRGTVADRTYKIISSDVQPKVFRYRTEVDTADYIIDTISQSLTFLSVQKTDDIILIEPYFTQYFLSRGTWEQTNADIIVYINNSPSSIKWAAYPSLGMIQFERSLSRNDFVYVSLIKRGAYLLDVGVTPHSEIFQTYSEDLTVFTLLTQVLSPTDNTIFVRSTATFPSNTRYIKIGDERIGVSVDGNNKFLIQSLRNTTVEYPVNTAVYLVKIESLMGLEDKLSMATSDGVPYHFHGLQVYNLSRLILTLRRYWNDITGQAPVYPLPSWTSHSDAAVAEGVVRSKFHLFDVDPLDSLNTFDSLYRGLEPNDEDYMLHAQALFCAYAGKDLTEAGALIGTDHGIWRRDASLDWQLVSDLSRTIEDGTEAKASRIFFIKDFRGDIYAGSDIGLWSSDDGGITWIFNTLYPEAIYNIETGNIDWTSSRNETGEGSSLSGQENDSEIHYYEAFLKDNGICFVMYKERGGDSDGTGEFWSDHIYDVDGKDTYCLSQYDTISTKEVKGVTYLTRTSSIFLGAENGLWALGNVRKASDSYSSFINATNVIPADKRAFVSKTVDNRGATSTYITENLRIYDILVSPKLPSGAYSTETNTIGFGNGALILLTNDGIRLSHDWAWAKYQQELTTTFDWHESASFTEAPLSGLGIICNCYLLVPNTFAGYNSAESWKYWKLLLGTNKGVYYSLDGGYNWSPCKKMPNGAQDVYELRYENSVLYALTDTGMIMSNDYGENWYRDENFNLTKTVFMQHGYLYSQVFQPEHNEITKISLFLHRRPDLDLSDESFDYTYEDSIRITVKLYNTIATVIDGEIVYQPNNIIAISATTYSYTDIIHDGWWSFWLNYTIPAVDWGKQFAIVVEETSIDYEAETSQGLIGWMQSSRSDPYTDGSYWKKDISSGTYTYYQSEDFFFLVHYNSDNIPEETSYTVSYNQEYANNIAVTQSNGLVLDTRFIFGFLIDGSGSMSWMDEHHSDIKRLFDPLTKKRIQYMQEFIGQLLARSRWSYVDIWSFDSDLRQITYRGLTRDIAEINSLLASIVSEGDDSEVYAGGSFAFSNMGEQGIKGALERDEDFDWAISYMQDMGRIDHAYLQTLDPTYDGVASSLLLPEHKIAMDYVIQDFVDSYARAAFMVTDGWDTSSGDETWEDLGLTIDSIKNEGDVPLFAFGLGYSSEQSGLMAACKQTGGAYFTLSDYDNLWETTFSRLLNGDYYLFKGTYTDSIDFGENIKFIKSIYLPAYIPSVDKCQVELEIRWTTNFKTWSEWKVYTPNTTHTLDIFANVIEYKITLYEGDTVSGDPYVPYDSSYDDYGYYDAVSGEYPSPVVGELQYVIVTPATNYYYTNAEQEDAILEYLLTYNAVVPNNAVLNWGICRGNSHNWSAYENIIENSKGILSNREDSIYYSPAFTIYNVKTTDIYQRKSWMAIDSSGATLTWSATDVIAVYVDQTLVDPNSMPYTLAHASGVVEFSEAIQYGRSVYLNITTPGQALTKNGEDTIRINNFTFMAINGPWSSDAQVVIYRNLVPMFSGYTLFPSEGRIQFHQYVDSTEEIRIAILTEGSYKIGLQTLNYSINPIDLTDFAIQYSTISASDLASLFGDTNAPEARNVKLECASKSSDESETVNGEEATGTIRANMHSVPYLRYDFYHRYSYPESGTEIKWYRQRLGETSFQEVTSLRNKITKEISQDIDLLTNIDSTSVFAQGDTWYVTITPKTQYATGTTIQTNSVIIGVEYQTTVLINTPPIITNVKVYKDISAGNENPSVTATGTATELTGSSAALYDYYKEEKNVTYWIKMSVFGADVDRTRDIVTNSRVMWFRNRERAPVYDNYGILANKITGTTGYDQWSLPSGTIKPNDSWYAVIIPRDGSQTNTYRDYGQVVLTPRIELQEPAET